jgi:hypothetical protein
MALVIPETAQVMKTWEAWYGELGSAVVDPGYTPVEAGSLDEPVRMAQGCPVLQGGGDVSVFGTFEVG